VTLKEVQKMLRELSALKKHGIEYPLYTWWEARRAKIELAVLCAVLDQESGGGRNVFGHDPTIFAGAGTVTKAKYLAYKKQRGSKGEGGMQGVGPMQLTWYSFQDRADKLGGCWKPQINIRVGCEILRRYMDEWGTKPLGLWKVFKTYNGSEAYATAVMARVAIWRRRLP
jgi:soluble lytic murein transglycosylase-like protein